MSIFAIILFLGVLIIVSVQGYVSYQHEWRFGKKYMISMEHEPFNLAKMNDRCKALGGYLVQIDNKEESDFLLNLAGHISGGGPFFTGINDAKRESYFYHYNDNSEVKYMQWRYFQPDNWWGEDCVEVTFYGLNDIGCEKRGRYLCEI
ncbi:collectin-12 [Plakobranchus ocellatus]|uniref:Collectin-12 n=1 Tax=Plakobranchus ocellatus TaxID=259542 RepID=A0AAV4CB51_9GAST|nr:collectin-12 [Plakobranchus ocellatus]